MRRGVMAVAIVGLALAAGCAASGLSLRLALPRRARVEAWLAQAGVEPPEAWEFAPEVAPGPSTARRAVLFLPDRVLDALDMVSAGVGLGFGFDVNVHLTRFIHAPALGIYWAISPVQWRYGRNLSLSFDHEFELGLGPLVMYKAEFFGGGTGWGPDASREFSKLGLVSPNDRMLREGFRDPWAVGASVGPILLPPRAEVDVHPVEVADFVVGLFTLGFVDLAGDDWALR